MEEIKIEFMKAGETYVGVSGDSHKVLAVYYNTVNKRHEVITERTSSSGKTVSAWYASEYVRFYNIPPTLAGKFQKFRSVHGSGSGQEYWEGLARIAEDHFKNLISNK